MTTELPLRVNLIISHKHNQPCLELRRTVTNLNLIKDILSCAFDGRSIIVVPSFQDRLKSIGSLVEKGILFYDKESKNYKFCF